jgi:radical SAM superfamily enzyme YgiQ (UPF0313 family)
VRVVLISTYDLGHQPFGLASPAAWLRAEGHHVTTADLSGSPPRQPFPQEAVHAADWVAFHLPMHTATRMAVPLIESIRRTCPSVRICCYGLYASVNLKMLRALGVTHIIGGEFERELAAVVSGHPGSALPVILDRLPFLMPDRSAMPPLHRYAGLMHAGTKKIVGYTEASRGCKHLCRHCPIVPVYEGKFRVVQRDVVLSDIRQQVVAGAQHITFGDPDFLNGPGHALALVEAFANEFPGITYDVIIKVEHLLKHRDALPVLARTGCLFITSAVESVDDGILARLAKGHSRADFAEALALTISHGLTLVPTFIAFTPWTTQAGYRELLQTVRDLELVNCVAPIQLAIRLLIPAGSKLLELADLAVGPFDPAALSYRWIHPDPEMDLLCADLQKLIRAGDGRGASRNEMFSAIWHRAFGEFPDFHLADRVTIPYMTEPWYC